MGLSRRTFLTRVGQAGGFGAAFLAMQGLGLVEARGEIADEPIAAAPGSGKGTRVGGCWVEAWRAWWRRTSLRALGYDCTVLEARERPGGRNYSVRGGDTVALGTGADHFTQNCTWDAGHYQNFGPARLPSIHPNILGYCKTLGVELQVEVNMDQLRTPAERLRPMAANPW